MRAVRWRVQVVFCTFAVTRAANAVQLRHLGHLEVLQPVLTEQEDVAGLPGLLA